MVAPPHARPAAPAGVGFDVVPECVLRVAGLVDRVDAVGRLTPLDEPGALVVPDMAALDLDHHDPRVGHEHEQVSLVVLVAVRDAEAGQDDTPLW